MDLRHTHLLELTITGLNAPAVHTEESLFCRGVWLHIGSMRSDHRDTVARIELIAERFTDIATVTKHHRTKR